MQTLQDLVESFPLYGERRALSWEGGSYTYQELYDEVIHRSNVLLSLAEPKTHIVHYADSNPQWIITSLAINYAGMVDVPRGKDASSEEMCLIVDHSDASLALAQNASAKEMLEKQLNGQKRNIPILNMDELDKKVSVHKLPKLSSDDLATIIYTSGTTGNPKGVMLTHGNLVANMEQTAQAIDMDTTDKLVCILPLWHAFERMGHYVALQAGAEIFYPKSKLAMKKDIAEQQPTVLISVPRLWEAIYQGIQDKLENASRPRKIIASLFPFLVHKKIREGLGGKMRYAISGGAKLPQYLHNYFSKAGIKIVEGYGLTEASPVVSGSVTNTAPGYVGTLLPGIDAILVGEHGQQVAQGKEGELWVSGPNIMKGYYKNSKATNEIILYRKGKRWLATGDIANKTDSELYMITGRKKRRFKNMAGEFIDPETIEGVLTKSPYIISVFVNGVNQKFPTASIFPDFEKIANVFSYSKNTIKLMRKNNQYPNQIIKFIADEVAKSAKHLPGKDKPHEIEIVGKEFPQTQTYKIIAKKAEAMLFALRNKVERMYYSAKTR